MPTLILPIPPGANRIWRTYRNATVKSKEARVFEQIALPTQHIGKASIGLTTAR